MWFLLFYFKYVQIVVNPLFKKCHVKFLLFLKVSLCAAHVVPNLAPLTARNGIKFFFALVQMRRKQRVQGE